MENDLNLLKSCLEEAGVCLMSYWGRRIDIQKKPDSSLVTEADLAAEAAILDKLKKNCPDDLIYSEEFGLSGQRSPGRTIWVIDPLDGTTNFANGYPCFCISIARGIIDESGELTMHCGGIFDPVRNKLYLAKKGQGATLNGQPLCVAADRPFEDTFLVTGFYTHKDEVLRREVERFYRVANKCSAVRRDGSAALDLALVAEGVFDGFWEFGLKPWDMAAGALLIQEAGGTVCNYKSAQGIRFNLEGEGIIAGSNLVVKELGQLI